MCMCMCNVHLPAINVVPCSYKAVVLDHNDVPNLIFIFSTLLSPAEQTFRIAIHVTLSLNISSHAVRRFLITVTGRRSGRVGFSSL